MSEGEFYFPPDFAALHPGLIYDGPCGALRRKGGMLRGLGKDAAGSCGGIISWDKALRSVDFLGGRR